MTVAFIAKSLDCSPGLEQIFKRYNFGFYCKSLDISPGMEQILKRYKCGFYSKSLLRCDGFAVDRITTILVLFHKSMLIASRSQHYIYTDMSHTIYDCIYFPRSGAKTIENGPYCRLYRQFSVVQTCRVCQVSTHTHVYLNLLTNGHITVFINMYCIIEIIFSDKVKINQVPVMITAMPRKGEYRKVARSLALLLELCFQVRSRLAASFPTQQH